jgi:endonuclease YncB( thermonuclease family)
MESVDKNTPFFGFEGETKQAKVMSVYDGDSVTIATLVYNVPYQFKCRISGIDTPELKPPKSIENRERHVEAGFRARNRVAQLVTNCPVELDDMRHKLDIEGNTKLVDVVCGKFDKYGRLLIDVVHDKTTLSRVLIDEGVAKMYEGGTKEKWTF